MTILTLLATIAPAIAGSPAVKRLEESIKIGKELRTYTVCIPSSWKGTPVPLVIVLHGAFGNAWSAEYGSQMTCKAQKEGFIVVYPNGTGPFRKFFLTWNVGPCSRIPGYGAADDLAFLRQLIMTLRSQYTIDPRRIYVTGLSNGGMMAYQIGAKMPDLVAAICPVASCMFSVSTENKSPLSIIAIHCMNDRVIPFKGGRGWYFGYPITTTRVADAIEYWVNRNGCSATPVHERIGLVSKDTYSGGAQDSEVCLCTIDRGGHAWPGGRRVFPLADRPPNCLSATDLMWDFFVRHPKKKWSNQYLAL